MSNTLEKIVNKHITLSDQCHRIRFIKTLESLQSYLPTDKTIQVLELGGQTIFTAMLQNAFPNVAVTSSTWDLRHPFPSEHTRQQYDLVVCMEVIEHLKDVETPNDIGSLATFCGSGIYNMFHQSSLCLKQGGILFVTTPNVCNYRAIWNLMQGEHPFTYKPHPRELTKKDVVEYAEKWQLFKTRDVQMHTVWYNHGLEPGIVNQLESFLKMMNCQVGDDARADDMFFFFEKL